MARTISVRGYEDRDLDTCRGLWVELTQRHRDLYASPKIGGDDPGAEFDEHLAKVGSENIFVAESGEPAGATVVGFVGLIPGESPELEPIVVSSAARGRGVGKALVDHLFETAKARGIRRLVVRPVARNADALHFFHNRGFQTLGQVELFAWLAPRASWGRAGATLCDVDFDV